MRIMCLNGWGGRLHAALLPYLRDSAPDILCLQEVVHTPGAPSPVMIYRDLGQELPQRSRMFDEVAEALPHHNAIFCPAAQGDLWQGETSWPSQWGLATFVQKTLPIVGQMQGFVHKGYGPDGYGDHPRSRSAHVVRVYDHGARMPVTVAHMHGLRDLAGKQDTPARKVQAERFAAMVSAVAEPGDRIVVCGDFNVLPDSETLGVLGAMGLTELVTARGHAGTRSSFYPKPGKFADYMLVNAPLTDAGFEVVRDPEVSDHCPLVLTI